VLDDPGLGQALRAKGLLRANDFCWEKCAAQTLAVYQELL
jgi:hypothetical protein